ncbi:MAG: type II toxin-antitoxin system HipA family toxin, partial [Bacteroides oleiciplenus]|nr:type II toxin-antitoxin system HipA family toxin [Bacteroides oleiciplenus]
MFQHRIHHTFTLNDDAHLKNFSLINKDEEYRLSPAYDLINTS